MKEFWLIGNESIDNINELLGSNFRNDVIKYFKQYNYIYISMEEFTHWGHMPYPYYFYEEKEIGLSRFSKKSIIKKSSYDFYINKGFEFKGEISRRQKLKILSELNENRR